MYSLLKILSIRESYAYNVGLEVVQQNVLWMNMRDLDFSYAC